jgi:two-component system response regulator PilR (NtrC family)
MKKHKVLVVDDEADIRELLEITLNRMGLDTRSASNLAGARRLLRDETFQLCLTDMRLPDGTGIDLVRTVTEHHPNLPIAVVTAFGSVEAAIDSLKAGAFDFVSKPVELEQLRRLVNSALKLESTPDGFSFADEPQLLGNTPAIKTLRKQIAKLARSQAPVYISGESGTGKELVARLIHANGPRASGPFVPVNCGAIPGELMESEFFGYKKGSFTGAREDKPGLFQAAQGGTLFLDEVADLPLNMQVKLLRAIQEKAVRSIGGNEEIGIDCRILSATHKDLAREVEAERFRGDLFYRINVIQLEVPSLRQRQQDIPLLTDFILENLAKDWAISKPELDSSALGLLQTYSFPGNVRELENILERAATLCEANHITADDLQLSSEAGVTRGAGGADTRTHAQEALFPQVDTSAPVQSLETYLEGIEKDIIYRALERCRWNKTEAARALGISFRALRYRLKKLELE